MLRYIQMPRRAAHSANTKGDIIFEGVSNCSKCQYLYNTKTTILFVFFLNEWLIDIFFCLFLGCINFYIFP